MTVLLVKIKTVNFVLYLISRSSQVRWLGGWVTSNHLGVWALHSWVAHLWSHHNWTLGSAWSQSSNGVVLPFELSQLNSLLVLNLLLDILISLEQFVMLSLSKLQSFVKVSLKLLLKCIHFVLLLLNELSFTRNDFLLSILHVLLSFLDLEFLSLLLDLMCLCVPI